MAIDPRVGPEVAGRDGPRLLHAEWGEMFSLRCATTRVRLVVACHSYYPAVGGVERLAQGVAEQFARRGVDTTVVTRRDAGTVPSERVNGVNVIRIPMTRVAGFHFPRGYLRTLRELNPDVFHLIGNRVWCVDFYFPFARNVRWPLVMTGHGFYQYEMHRRAWDRWYFERYLPRCLRRVDVYTADTVHERDQLVGWGVDPSRIEILPAAVSLDEFVDSRSNSRAVRSRWGFKAPHVAVYVGGFYANKRVDRLVRAVAATGGTWALVAIGRDLPGGAHDRASVARLASELGAEVALSDVLPRGEVLDALAAADAVALGSSYEGFGILLLEAMAMGRPFVAFRTGAAPELAATGSGFCVDTIEEFTAALGKLTDPTTRTALGARGREVVPAYSVDELVRRLSRTYERAVEHSGASR